MIDAKVFEQAIVFAVASHKGQARKGDGRPYILHPLSVMNRLYSVKKSKNVFLLGAACVLHDVVEDCGVTLREIADIFGYHVASLVQELTLDKEKYETIGKREYLAQEMMKMSSYALCIKLCDSLDNVSDLLTMGNSFRVRYTEETLYLMRRIKERKLTKTHKKLRKKILRKLKPFINDNR
jgi:guanosine-3',5'-bis(diphosphate) 3'-pyrophosphohydrolase